MIVTLMEEENRFMEKLFTQVLGREIIRLGKSAILRLPPKNPQPPNVTIINIVVKLLDPIKFPVQSQYTGKMINDLSILGLLIIFC
jgi:hypothetical protein